MNKILRKFIISRIKFYAGKKSACLNSSTDWYYYNGKISGLNVVLKELKRYLKG
jgi:hypothetical protein